MATMDIQLRHLYIIAVGELDPMWREAAETYRRRLGNYVTFTEREIRQDRGKFHGNQMLARQADAICQELDAIPGSPRILLCDERGKNITTQDLYREASTCQSLALIVGGAWGVADMVRERAHRAIAFGNITLPHQLARVIALEQCYRVMTMARNEPYHH